MARKFVCTTTEPVVQTSYGKLRGFILDGTYTFYGISTPTPNAFSFHPSPELGRSQRRARLRLCLPDAPAG